MCSLLYTWVDRYSSFSSLHIKDLYMHPQDIQSSLKYRIISLMWQPPPPPPPPPPLPTPKKKIKKCTPNYKWDQFSNFHKKHFSHCHSLQYIKEICFCWFQSMGYSQIIFYIYRIFCYLPVWGTCMVRRVSSRHKDGGTWKKKKEKRDAIC